MTHLQKLSLFLPDDYSVIRVESRHYDKNQVDQLSDSRFATYCISDALENNNKKKKESRLLSLARIGRNLPSISSSLLRLTNIFDLWQGTRM